MRSVKGLVECARLGTPVLLVGAVGCGVLTSQPPPPPPVQPDMKAIVAVVAEAYGQLEQAASVFLGADGVEDTTMARVRTTLDSDLETTFHPPSERATGDPGASIVLGRFSLGEDGRLSVVASFVQEDGTGRGCTQYTLDREDDDWLVVGATDAWPDCPISTQGEESYHAAVERARSDECLRLGTGIGTCGPWLYVVESSGYHGTTSYFDPRTGLLVAKRFFDDTSLDYFVFGEDLGCEPTVTESIPCGECQVDEDCDDGVGCTRDTCDAGMCLNTPNDANCPNDAQFCNGTESCDAIAGCVSDGGPCPPELFCNEDVDSCDEPPVPGQPCKTDEDCPSGVCPGGFWYQRFHCVDQVCGEVLYESDPCEPATMPWIECGGDPSIRGCDYSSTAVCGDDNRAYRNASEACCFVSRYQEGSCSTGTLSRADECSDTGGFWECGGLMQCWYCNRHAVDAGEPCTDGRECEGWCIAEGFLPTSQACSDADLRYYCSATTVMFGCFCEMYEGQGEGICVD